MIRCFEDPACGGGYHSARCFGGVNEHGAPRSVSLLLQAERALARVEAIADGWVGFDDTHYYGDRILMAIYDREEVSAWEASDDS